LTLCCCCSSISCVLSFLALLTALTYQLVIPNQLCPALNLRSTTDTTQATGRKGVGTKRACMCMFVGEKGGFRRTKKEPADRATVSAGSICLSEPPNLTIPANLHNYATFLASPTVPPLLVRAKRHKKGPEPERFRPSWL
jgi:hypothetical protein